MYFFFIFENFTMNSQKNYQQDREDLRQQQLKIEDEVKKLNKEKYQLENAKQELEKFHTEGSNINLEEKRTKISLQIRKHYTENLAAMERLHGHFNTYMGCFQTLDLFPVRIERSESKILELKRKYQDDSRTLSDVSKQLETAGAELEKAKAQLRTLLEDANQARAEYKERQKLEDDEAVSVILEMLPDTIEEIEASLMQEQEQANAIYDGLFNSGIFVFFLFFSKFFSNTNRSPYFGNL